jgi:signal transduction histidine kinase
MANMSHPDTTQLLRWLPGDARQGVVQRALVVWAVALVIAVLQTLANPVEHAFDKSLVYSYAISTCIWFLCDPMRIALGPWLHIQPPHYWSVTPRAMAYMFFSIVVGYALGSLMGDAYAGQSTWQLMAQSPQRFWSFWLTSLGISCGFLFYFYQREKGLELARQATEARLKLLESQLQPHMLFNTLANLRALIATDPQRAIDMLDRLNDYLRATLRAARTDSGCTEHTLADEFARLRDYLELMAVRMGVRLSYSLHLPDALAQHPVPPLLLQPLVENAIQHGLEPKVEGGSIAVHASQTGSTITLEVADTGMGFDATALARPATAGRGYGLSHVRERLNTLYGAEGTINLVADYASGTRASVTFPDKR